MQLWTSRSDIVVTCQLPNDQSGGGVATRRHFALVSRPSHRRPRRRWSGAGPQHDVQDAGSTERQRADVDGDGYVLGVGTVVGLAVVDPPLGRHDQASEVLWFGGVVCAVGAAHDVDAVVLPA